MFMRCDPARLFGIDLEAPGEGGKRCTSQRGRFNGARQSRPWASGFWSRAIIGEFLDALIACWTRGSGDVCCLDEAWGDIPPQRYVAIQPSDHVK